MWPGYAGTITNIKIVLKTQNQATQKNLTKIFLPYKILKSKISNPKKILRSSLSLGIRSTHPLGSWYSVQYWNTNIFTQTGITCGRVKK